MIELQTCPKVPADLIQGMMRELQKQKFMVVLDLNEPNARTCTG